MPDVIHQSLTSVQLESLTQKTLHSITAAPTTTVAATTSAPPPTTAAAAATTTTTTTTATTTTTNKKRPRKKFQKIKTKRFYPKFLRINRHAKSEEIS